MNIEALARSLHAHIKRYADPVFTRHEQRLAALEAEVTALRKQAEHWKNIGYEGVYDPNAIYHRGNFVTHKGAWWHCEVESTTDVPGTSSSWKLCAKGHQR